MSGDIAVVGASEEDGAGSIRGAAYIFERNQGGADSWGQVTKVTASDAEDQDIFGRSAAISGDTVVIGAYGEDGAGGHDRGAAYIFERNWWGEDTWGAVKKLAGSAVDDAWFGYSVAISGDSIVVGAPRDSGGAVYIFERNYGGADAWNWVVKLGSIGEFFGGAVAISGDTTVVGAQLDDSAGDSSGTAFVFERNQGGPNTWGLVAQLAASDAAEGDCFGISVAVSGDTALVGANGEDGVGGNARGAAYLFRRNQGGAAAWGQVTKLTASDAANGDQFGLSLAISGDRAVVGAPHIDLDVGAAYIFERNQGGADAWGQVTKLTISEAADHDHLGYSVAISADTVVAGAYGRASGRGAAYLFVVGGGHWQEVAIPGASDAADEDWFGRSAAISSDTIVVGAHGEDSAGSSGGAAYIFTRNRYGADNWGEVKKLVALDGQDGDYFGYAVAISGDTIVVGAYGEDGGGNNRGAAYVFARNYDPGNPSTPLADNWGQVKKLHAIDAENIDWFGYSVAISADTVVAGAPGEDSGGNLSGAAYLFERNQGGKDNWGQAKKLTASDAAEGDFFGRSLAVSTDTVVVGAIYEGGAGTARGAAYVFARNQGGVAESWGQVKKLTASDTADEDCFGRAVAISWDTILVGADREDGGGSDWGAAYLFERNQGGKDNWGQMKKLTASDAADEDQFGISVAISGDTVVVGAWTEDGAGTDRGTAYVFERNQGGADSWGQVSRLTASDAADEDWFGQSVSIGDDAIVVGACGADGGGLDRGTAYIFSLQPYRIFLPLIRND
jgi:hypothetical protein